MRAVWNRVRNHACCCVAWCCRSLIAAPHACSCFISSRDQNIKSEQLVPGCGILDQQAHQILKPAPQIKSSCTESTCAPLW
jgi:hypothetical protein